MKRRGRVTVEPIDLDLVFEEKYPNRKAERELAQMAALLTSGPVANEFEALVADSLTPGALDPADADLAFGSFLDPEPAPVAEARARLSTDAAMEAFFAERLRDPEPPPRRRTHGRPSGAAAPDAPWVPLACEPEDDALFSGVARKPLPARVEHPKSVDSPYEALRRRRDRIARQAVEAFSQVHDLRTAALRQAAESEHQATLANTARGRASRIARGERPAPRVAEVPGRSEAFDDVHRLRVAALRRAAEAEHGADAVARARERAQRLLAEQRRLEQEMSALRRGASA